MTKMKPKIALTEKKLYEKIIEQATVDCYDEEEQTVGWECILDENICTPCECVIGKEKAILEKVTSDDCGNVMIGVVRLNKTKLRVVLRDIILEDPKAMQYINAYIYWCKNG